MKNIFKIHFSSYIFYLILILSGYINYLIIYFFIIIVHELGHVLIIKLMHININKITVYPFGGVIDTNINYNINSNKLFFISIAGVLAQSVLFLLIKDNNSYQYEIFKTLNISLIIFNLLPIIPSDGNKLIVSFLERVLSYRSTIILTNIISIAMLLFVFLISKNIFLFIVLYYINARYIYLFKYILNKFKLERYLYKPRYKKKVYIENEEKIKKCRNNHIKCDNIYIEEDAYFQKKFGAIY